MIREYYYIDKGAQTNGDHEVHTKDCVYMPEARNRRLLGPFRDCEKAMEAARKYYRQVIARPVSEQRRWSIVEL